MNNMCHWKAHEDYYMLPERHFNTDAKGWIDEMTHFSLWMGSLFDRKTGQWDSMQFGFCSLCKNWAVVIFPLMYLVLYLIAVFDFILI